ncbi:PREDICTED: L-galactose dehydrogenase-like [Polistes canadensis]|uniref:L-galactose dehydrogenase-like n=1 Tax=Polistes canadensis TaxID=91411 RepID=UPI000718AC11|nr:PREDICTED: L-galactose dehydrogenase-like [Polistes canadensis]
MLPPTYVEGFHDLETIKAMKYDKLGNTNLYISKLSFGSGPLGVHYGNFDEKEAIETIRQAIKEGINYIDTSPWYGQGKSEKIIGKALEGIPRQAYYIATKVGRYELNVEKMFDFSREKTRDSIKNSLSNLKLNYVDIIQVHDIEFAPSLDVIISQTLPELSKQVADKKARYIGITGYPISVLKECIERSNIDIACVLTYSRFTLLDNSLIQYIEFFKNHNIGIINASLLAMGLLTSSGPPSWHPASEEIKNTCSDVARYCKENNVEISKLAVWYAMECEHITTSLIGIQNMQQLIMNLNVSRNGITDKEKELLNLIKENYLNRIELKHWEGVELKKYWQTKGDKKKIKII